MSPCLIITKNPKWSKLFHSSLIFDTLSDEHILRILFLQKIKLEKSIKDTIKIYLDEIELDEMNINPKLYSILKYQSGAYYIKLCNINEGFDKTEIESYNNIILKKNG